MGGSGVKGFGGKFGDGVKGGVGKVNDGLKNGVSSVSETVSKLGATAGFQSLFGNIDKSDAGLEKAFKSVDADSSGKISSAEMEAYILKVYGKGLDEKIVSDMMAAADTDKDGEVDLEEF